MYATVSELKELKEWLLGGCKDINEQPRTELEKEIKRLNHIVSNKDKAIKELQQDNQELRKANQAYLSYQFKLEEKIKAYEKNIDYWKDEISSKQEDIEVFKNALTYWQTQSKEIALAKNPNEELKEQKNYFENEYYRLVRENNELKEKNESLLKDNITIVTDIELLEKENKALEQSEETLFKKNQELITANQILKKSVDELTDVISLKERDIKDLVEKNNELQKNIKELIKTNEELTAIEKNNNSGYAHWLLKPYNDKIKELQSKVDKFKNAMYQSTTKEIFTMPQDKINTLMFKLASTINKEYPYNTSFTTLDNLHENIIQVIKFMQSKIYDLEKENQELQDNLKLRTAELNTYIAEYESLEQKKINLEVEVESLNSELNDIKQVLKQSNTELKHDINWKNEVIELQANLIEAKAIVDLHLSNIASLEKDKLRLQETNNKLNQDNQRLYNHNCDLSLSLNKLKSENDNLRTENYELENLDNEEIKKLSKEIENLNLENSKVWHRNKELEDTSKKFIDSNTKLESELKQIKTISYDNLLDSYNSLNKNYHNLKIELEELDMQYRKLKTKSMLF